MEQEVRGITSIKTSQKSKIRSMPRAKGSEYLDLFLLGKNKARLEKEKTNVEKRTLQVVQDLKTIDEEISELEIEISGSEPKKTAVQAYKKKVPKKPMTVMRFDY